MLRQFHTRLPHDDLLYLEGLALVKGDVGQHIRKAVAMYVKHLKEIKTDDLVE